MWRLGAERQGVQGTAWVWVNGQVADENQGDWSVIVEDADDDATCLTYWMPTETLDDGRCHNPGKFICEYDLDL